MMPGMFWCARFAARITGKTCDARKAKAARLEGKSNKTLVSQLSSIDGLRDLKTCAECRVAGIEKHEG